MITLSHGARPEYRPATGVVGQPIPKRASTKKIAEQHCSRADHTNCKLTKEKSVELLWGNDMLLPNAIHQRFLIVIALQLALRLHNNEVMGRTFFMYITYTHGLHTATPEQSSLAIWAKHKVLHALFSCIAEHRTNLQDATQNKNCFPHLAIHNAELKYASNHTNHQNATTAIM